MRVLLWHGWLLEGSGSNVSTARLAKTLASAGHDVLLLCQETHPERYGWISACGTVGADGLRLPREIEAATGPGRCVLLRPEIGTLLPVFVPDEYEGFRVKRFVELTDQELDRYLERNVEAFRVGLEWHRSDAVIAGHAIPGAVVARRAAGPGAYVVQIHGSDLEYAVSVQERYRELAREGLLGARAVTGGTKDVLARCEELVPGVRRLSHVVPPGVDTERFRPMVRRQALLDTASLLDRVPEISRGRSSLVDEEVKRALVIRNATRLDDLARTYNQQAPDAEAATRLRELAAFEGPIVGYFGKLIPQKGVHLLLAAVRASAHRPLTLVVGFGLQREWLTALAMALREPDAAAVAWLTDAGGLTPEPLMPKRHPPDPAGTVVFTGRLDHRYAPGALAAMDVLVVPSVLPEAFGMVAAEGAAAGALPLLARHSGLAEVATTLEGVLGRPGLFSFEPGPGAASRIVQGLDRLLSLPAGEREVLRREVALFTRREWSWNRTSRRLLELVRS
ncbi:MAG TPA: glycosyltransferase [Actinomycetota bacterium]